MLQRNLSMFTFSTTESKLNKFQQEFQFSRLTLAWTARASDMVWKWITNYSSFTNSQLLSPAKIAQPKNDSPTQPSLNMVVSESAASTLLRDPSLAQQHLIQSALTSRIVLGVFTSSVCLLGLLRVPTVF